MADAQDSKSCEGNLLRGRLSPAALLTIFGNCVKIKSVNSIFDFFSWLAMAILLITAIPQIVLNYKRGSTEGASWLTFGMLFFGMTVLAIRSWFVTTDIIILLNYNLGAVIVL